MLPGAVSCPACECRLCKSPPPIGLILHIDFAQSGDGSGSSRRPSSGGDGGAGYNGAPGQHDLGKKAVLRYAFASWMHSLNCWKMPL